MSVTLYGVTDALDAENMKFKAALDGCASAMNEITQLFESDDFKTKSGWKQESESDGNIVHSKHVSYGKLFALKATFPGPIDLLFNDHWHDVETVPNWNTNFEFSNRLATIGIQADVINYALNDILIVRGREFLCGRMWRKIDDCYVVAAKSFEHADVVGRKNKVRADLHLGGGRFKSLSDNSTAIDYVLCMDFKGAIPRAIVNAAMSKMMLADAALNMQHVKKIVADAANG